MIQRILDAVWELAATYRPLIQKNLAAMGYGLQRLSPEEDAAFFELMARANPNWVMALPFVEGGPELIRRYQQVRQIGSYGPTYPDVWEATVPTLPGRA